MPHYLIQEKNKTPVLVHEAPIDEKTKEIRKRFDVDEETGYPRQYNWRPLAKLGAYYRPERIYEVVEPYPEERKLSTKITLVGGMAVVIGVFHTCAQAYKARPLYTKAWVSLGAWVGSSLFVLWAYGQKENRRRLTGEVYADYMKKHPDRFETVHRPKFREVLFYYQPIR